jgi:hypothetical protein
MLSPYIYVPAVITSGFMCPMPSNNDHVDIPLDENGATLDNDASRDPTPITLIKSPGLFSVP